MCFLRPFNYVDTEAFAMIEETVHDSDPFYDASAIASFGMMS
jgi:hypothetical protein